MVHEGENTDSVYTALSESKLDCSQVIEFVKSPQCGAVVYFGGTTRDSMEGKNVSELSYEAYIPMALKTLTEIANDAINKWDQVHKVAIVHRLGNVPVLEESVGIAVSAAHRKHGWESAEWILEQLKKSAEIWKSEKYTDGTSVWRSNDEDSKYLDSNNNNNNSNAT